MNDAIIPDVRKSKNKISVRFRNINLLLLVGTLLLLAAVALVMITDITDDASQNYARFYANETVKTFNLFFEKDLALVKKVSRTKTLHAWFADENDPQKKSAAYDEIMDYAEMVQSAYLYFCIDQSLNEYAVQSQTGLDLLTPFDTLDPEIAYNSWYFDCLRSEDTYTLNIDVDKATQVQRLWINHKVLDNDGKVLGVFCSGLPLNDVLEEIFSPYDAQSARGFVIDSGGTIQMDSQASEHSNFPEEDERRHIREMSSDAAFTAAMDSYLQKINGYFAVRHMPEVIRLGGGDYDYISIAPIYGTDWTVVTLFSSNSLFSVARLLPILFVMLVAFVLYFVVGNTLMRQLVLAPLYHLTDSVSKTGTGDGALHVGERDDEFGELARTIHSMWDRLNANNLELTNTAKERERQERLLHAVNDAAAVLLAADEEDFEGSLREGMELMARCMDVDRIYIWRNETKGDVLYYSQEFEWLNHGQGGRNTQVRMSFAYADSIPEWEESLSRGNCINGPLDTLSATTRKQLIPFGMKSILVVPVYFQDHFWGFVSFDDCHRERTFTEDEVSILRSGSLMIVSALTRGEAAVKMREADERTKIMLDATPLCCNLWDENLVNLDCNEEAVKLFELKDKQEYLDRFEQLSPEFQPDGQRSSEKARDFIRQAFDTGRVVFEWVHQKLDGMPIPAEITLVRVRRSDDYIVAGYTRDLREYKKMMQEIEHKDVLLHSVNDVATILLQSEVNDFTKNLWRCMGMLARAAGADRVYIWQNHVVEGNLHGTQLYEWSEGAEPQQGTDYAIDIPYSSNMPGWEEILSSGRCVNGLVSELSEAEQAQLAPQGILSILVVPVFLRDQFWGFVGFDDCHRERSFSDNEESILRSGSLLIANALFRNEMNLEMQTAVAKMEAVISNFSGVIWSVDQNNIITLFNGLYLKKMGIRPEFLEGKSLEVARQKNRHQDIIENIAKTLNSGPQDWVSEVDGMMYRMHTTPIYDENGRITSVVGSLEDITDIIRLQRELELAVEQAQTASHAKSNFLSNMSHEMRTPMNAIIGMTSIGKSAADAERKDYAFGKIEDASKHLLAVINDILDMSKIEANKFEVSDVEFSFEKMLRKVVNVVSFRVDERRQHFSVTMDEAIPANLIGDDQRLTQVISNLLSNAIKFTPDEGSIRLEARLVDEKDAICTLQISVIDTGIGISSEQQTRLFSSFEQAESSTSRKFGGTGLGLAISKRIVELMGGSIWLESEQGKGSTFTFTVQLRRGESVAVTPLCAGLNRENMRILVVDDDSETREFFTSIAERFKIACDTASGGAEALQLLESNGPYCLYFIDWNMPDIDGIELTEAITARTVGPASIVMITASEWSEIEKEAKVAGVNHFLSKPLFPSAVADCINACLGLGNLSSATITRSEEPTIRYDSCILLAEDVAINREIVLAMLEPTGLTFDCAENGVEAVRMFSAAPERYGMIFMDVQMPEMDGLEATQRIRALSLPRAQEIPIVAMTANVFREDIEKCLAAGMNDHVGKPLDFDEVLVKIKRLLPHHT